MYSAYPALFVKGKYLLSPKLQVVNKGETIQICTHHYLRLY